jgi:hypothetical protein
MFLKGEGILPRIIMFINEYFSFIMQSTPNIRAQAITYLRSDKEFGIAFGKERNGKGYLPTQQPPSMHFPKHKQKISLTVEPSQDSVLIKNA